MGTAMGGQLIVHGSHIPQDRVSDVGGHEFTNVSGVIAFHFMHACMHQQHHAKVIHACSGMETRTWVMFPLCIHAAGGSFCGHVQ